jgi:hypothetical protein
MISTNSACKVTSTPEKNTAGSSNTISPTLAPTNKFVKKNGVHTCSFLINPQRRPHAQPPEAYLSSGSRSIESCILASSPIKPIETSTIADSFPIHVAYQCSLSSLIPADGLHPNLKPPKSRSRERPKGRKNIPSYFHRPISGDSIQTGGSYPE